MASATDNSWLVWQLLDSAFPCGGFAHSAGLEAAWQGGEVRGGAGLLSFIESALVQSGRSLLPLAGAACDDPARLPEVDRLCDALLTNAVANRASRAQGTALISTAQRIYTGAELGRIRSLLRSEGLGGHFAPVFGATLAALGLRRPETARIFVFVNLRGLVSAGVRLGIVGPIEGQQIQHRLAGDAQRVVDRFGNLPAEEAAQTAPIIELAQMNHDRLYSRLFQS